MTFRITNRWQLIVLVALGQLVVLLPGAIWFGGWFNHAIHDIVEQRLNTASKRHTLQLADLISDDLSVILSLALQNNIAPRDLGHSIGRLNDRPASIVGVLIDLLSEHDEPQNGGAA